MRTYILVLLVALFAGSAFCGCSKVDYKYNPDQEVNIKGVVIRGCGSPGWIENTREHPVTVEEVWPNQQQQPEGDIFDDMPIGGPTPGWEVKSGERVHLSRVNYYCTYNIYDSWPTTDKRRLLGQYTPMFVAVTQKK